MSRIPSFLAKQEPSTIRDLKEKDKKNYAVPLLFHISEMHTETETKDTPSMSQAQQAKVRETAKRSRITETSEQQGQVTQPLGSKAQLMKYSSSVKKQEKTTTVDRHKLIQLCPSACACVFTYPSI